MIRSIFVAILFFFGPALLMFMLRNLFLFLKVWLKIRKMRRENEHDIIDITPHKHGSPSMIFNVVAIVIGLICAILAWQEMNSGPESKQQYVPAHIGADGKIVPGKLVPAENSGNPDKN